MESLRVTKLWIVVDEESLTTMKTKDGLPAKFANEEEANMAASEKLNLWATILIHFNHKFLQHTV
tara:strand:- start:102 stop:296 length:195 start_codon:yes stop_codon:yes gene_type:complete